MFRLGKSQNMASKARSFLRLNYSGESCEHKSIYRVALRTNKIIPSPLILQREQWNLQVFLKCYVSSARTQFQNSPKEWARIQPLSK